MIGDVEADINELRGWMQDTETGTSTVGMETSELRIRTSSTRLCNYVQSASVGRLFC